MEFLTDLWQTTGVSALSIQNLIMITIALVFIYLAIKKKYEPYLLIPIAFGMLLVNLPIAGLMEEGGLLRYLYLGTESGVYPALIFLSVGASTDFAPLLANPKSLLLGAAAQFGIFFTFTGAILLSNLVPFINFTGPEAAATAIIGGADGPTAIYTAVKLAPDLLGSIAIAAYSYMALVPIIQPPIIKALTSKEERKIEMKQLRQVSKTEKVIFPIVVALFTLLLVPSAAPLIGMIMFGNLIKESGVVPRLTETASGPFMYILTILLGVTVGAKAEAGLFLTTQTLSILALGLLAFAVGTASGVLLAKLMNKLSNGKTNPMLGAAGVSAVPMAARVVQKLGQEENPSNFLLMHAMGPNVAGVIGSAVAAGVLLMLFG